MNDKTPEDFNDQLIDDFLDKPLKQEIPQADQALKKRAITMASDEFSDAFEEDSETTAPINKQETDQGNIHTARPIDNRNTASVKRTGLLSGLTQSVWSFFMNTNNNAFAYKAFGTAAVAFLAVSVVFMQPSTQTTTRLEDLAETAIRQPQPSVIEEIIVTARKNTEAGQGQAADSITADQDALGQSIADYSNAQPAEPALAFEDQSRAPLQAPISLESKAISVDSALVKRSSPVFPIDTNTGGTTTRLDEGEEYAEYQTNSIKLVSDEPVSTFSIDVDTASYSLVRNQLNSGLLPAPQSVRVEEFINYFNYDYPAPRSTTQPFEPTVSVFDSPWNDDKKLVHIGIKGYDIDASEQPDSNLVFLLDVSGSMNSANKLPLVKQSVGLLLDTLKPTDKVSIVVYAGAAGTVLEPTEARNKTKIIAALQNLSAGGSTAGGAGIQLAYQLAEQNFDKGAVNRIILATDGDFNVGQSSNEDLKTLVERKRSNGVYLSVLGFGRNNYQDDMMQTLAQNGNGVAAYIDSLSEAKKVLVDEATSTLFPIAKDVKIQVEFNPATVSEYRLVGYETRALNREDFNNDKVDAGDIGAGHTVTAIYEITPADAQTKSIDEPRYTQNKAASSAKSSDEYGFLKMRYKLPNSDISKLIETPIKATSISPNGEVQFSVAVAGFAQLLSNSQYTGNFSYNMAIDIANEHKGSDPFGYRSEFMQLVRMAQIARP